ncbi:MAG: HIT domain-containing protein [Candidatus Heimdallarchaeota archaeon]|nr:HIT domain-containing protein [Candidatus Heimdallarchaeota archaeon]
MKSNTNCFYCERSKKLEDSILYEGTNYQILMNLGPLYEGHILLATKKHISAHGATNPENFDEFEELFQMVVDFLIEEYNQGIIIFEHGNIAQNINHAHMHFLPNIGNFSLRDFDLDFLQLNNLNELIDVYQKNNHYLFFSSSENKFFVSYNEDVIKGFFRLEIAKKLDKKDRSNWIDVIRNKKLSIIIANEHNNLKEKWLKHFVDHII